MIVNVTVATSESWTDKATNQKVDKTEWHKIVFKSKLAPFAADYLKKGSKVYVEGSLSTRSWKDAKTGETKYQTEIQAHNFQILDKRDDVSPAAAKSYGAQAPLPMDSGFDDEIPF